MIQQEERNQIIHAQTAEQEEIMWEELESDPAAVACRELLSRLDEEDAAEEDACITKRWFVASRFESLES